VNGRVWWDTAIDRALRLGVLASVRTAGAAGTARDAYLSAGRAVLDRLAVNPVLNRVIDAQLTRLLPGLLDEVLQDILATLEADPERLRQLVRGQRESMVAELLDRLREGAAAGDGAADHLRDRLLRR
jgi:hypothetical protein